MLRNAEVEIFVWLRMSSVSSDSAKVNEKRQHSAVGARRRKRVVFGVSIALVLMFAAATVSYSLPYGVMSTGPQRWWAVGFASGDLLYLRGDSGGVLPQGLHWRTDRVWHRTARGANGTRVKVPYGLFAAAFGLAVSGLAYQTGISELRAKRGLCRVCEYDLRGLDVVDGHKTCPECGTRKRAVMKPG